MSRRRWPRWLLEGSFVALTALAIVPFWLTRILPMQDYPHHLLFARALMSYRDPSSPFFGAYTLGFPIAPITLPLFLLRGLGALFGIENAGKIIWSLSVLLLPVAAIDLLRVLRRDIGAALLVYPLLFSYWLIGGFFAFATGMPLLLFGLGAALRHFEAPSLRRGITLGALACALFLWHALLFAQLMLDVGILWILLRGGSIREKLRKLAPLVPSLALIAIWMLAVIQGRSPGKKPAAWPPFFENAGHFFDYIGPILPEGTGIILLFALVVAVAAMFGKPEAPLADEIPIYRVKNPFAWLVLGSAICYLVLPSTCFGVEGIQNRQAYLAALLFVFAWNVPSAPKARALVLSVLGLGSALWLSHIGRRFAVFNQETAGASRLIDRLGPGNTLLASLSDVSTRSFPGKPLVALDLYASVRHGGLPNASFAGYDINVIRYVGDKNPMPGISGRWAGHPELSKFDYLLVRAPLPPNAAQANGVNLVASDGGFWLYGICGSRAFPDCEKKTSH